LRPLPAGPLPVDQAVEAFSDCGAGSRGAARQRMVHGHHAVDPPISASSMRHVHASSATGTKARRLTFRLAAVGANCRIPLSTTVFPPPEASPGRSSHRCPDRRQPLTTRAPEKTSRNATVIPRGTFRGRRTSPRDERPNCARRRRNRLRRRARLRTHRRCRRSCRRRYPFSSGRYGAESRRKVPLRHERRSVFRAAGRC